MPIDWKEWSCPRGRAVVRFKNIKVLKEGGFDVVPIEGSALVLPALKGMERHKQDAWKKEEERNNRGTIVALGSDAPEAEFAPGDDVLVGDRLYGTLLDSNEAEGYEDRLFLWGEIGAWRKAKGAA